MSQRDDVRENIPGKGNGIAKILRQVQKPKNSSFWMEHGLFEMLEDESREHGLIQMRICITLDRPLGALANL